MIQSRAEIEGDLIATYRRLLGWTLVALLATLALAILVASQVSSPIAALRKTASAIASGAATLSTPVAQGELPPEATRRTWSRVTCSGSDVVACARYWRRTTR